MTRVKRQGQAGVRGDAGGNDPRKPRDIAVLGK